METRYARSWNSMKIGDRRIIRTLDCHQVQSQVGKIRAKNPSCRSWKWRTQTQPDGTLLVERIQ